MEFCSICLDEENVDNLITTECSHVYHKDCFIPWIKKYDKCPYCKTKLEQLNYLPVSEVDSLKRLYCDEVIVFGMPERVDMTPIRIIHDGVRHILPPGTTINQAFLIHIQNIFLSHEFQNRFMSHEEDIATLLRTTHCINYYTGSPVFVERNSFIPNQVQRGHRFDFSEQNRPSQPVPNVYTAPEVLREYLQDPEQMTSPIRPDSESDESDEEYNRDDYDSEEEREIDQIVNNLQNRNPETNI